MNNQPPKTLDEADKNLYHYLVVFLDVAVHFNLKGNQILIISYIYGFQRKGKEFYASQYKIAKSINCSYPTVNKILKQLIRGGLIENIGSKGKTNSYKTTDKWNTLAKEAELILKRIGKFPRNHY